MENQTFKITIDAPREKVWEILWGDTTYPLWTAPFSEGSHAKTDWEKGSKVLFLDGKGFGMVSTIVEKIPFSFMSFKHLGEIKNGKEDYDSDSAKQWTNALENFTLQPENGKTTLLVEMHNISPGFSDFLSATYPKALEQLKALAEKK